MSELYCYIFKVWTSRGWEKVRVVCSVLDPLSALKEANRIYPDTDRQHTTFIDSYPAPAKEYEVLAQ